MFWSGLDLEREAWPWVEQVLPAAGALDPQARAEQLGILDVLRGSLDEARALLEEAPDLSLGPAAPRS
ncbi:MAG TPA: hypothetical protein VKG61_22625 [Streptosporangiaceae bacterium]|nr:hypothetical protein [Streptosporangiaceae bacterium]